MARTIPTAAALRRRGTEGPAAAGFGATLRALRVRRGLSQSALAVLARVNHSLVSRMESGEREPTRPATMKLAAGLGLDADVGAQFMVAAGFVPEETATEAQVLLLGATDAGL